MKQTIFKGVGTALVTPFINDNINYDIFKKFIEFSEKGNQNLKREPRKRGKSVFVKKKRGIKSPL